MVAIQLARLVGWAVILLYNSAKVASGLRITSIEVPSAVMNASQVTLACNYELQGDQLYSVKWYKNYVEFYRFQPSGQSATGQDSQQQLSFGSKQEFELEGINLNLSKSNATHVHLKQTSISSEGTYKCEVSAESPSYATISSERLMKVYVLPRQKLSILDNSRQNHLAPPPNTSDLINLTCISAHSRPVPSLRWFINDTPVPPSSKWLLHHQPQRQQPYLATAEARLTLAFRNQPNLLAQITISDTNQTSISGNNHRLHPANKQQLEIRCVAEFSLEFVSETSIAVAGGKTSQPKRRNRDHQPGVAGEPVAAPQVASTADQSDHLRPIDGVPLRTGALRPGSRAADSRPLAARNQTIEVSPVRQQLAQLEIQQQQGAVVVTNKQLRARAEQIDQRLRLSRPNEMQPPLIEAKSQVPDYADLEADQTGTSEEEASEERLSSAAADGGSRVEEGFSHSISQPEARTTSNNYDNSDKDYQLNELALFICSPQPPQMPNLQSGVQFRWFINDKAIDLRHINHFDGNKFSLQQVDPIVARKSQANPSHPSTNHQQESEQSSLLIEFTPSLFQLKELDLKCQTLIVQPLIEYETILSANTPSSVQQQNAGTTDIEQTGGDTMQSTSRAQQSYNTRPWVLKQHSHHQQQRRNQVLRLQKQYNQQSSSSSPSSFYISVSSISVDPLQIAILVLNLLIVARVAQT